jgi:hypothetical protein
MRSPVSRLVRRSVKAGGNMVSQIIVSVAAAVCVAFITNAYLNEHNARKDADVNVSTASRVEASAPATQLATTQPAERPAPVLATLPEQDLPPLATQIITDLPVREINAEGAEIFPGVPSEDALAEALRKDGQQKRERRRFLGVPIPNFVPGPTQLVESASSAGGKIISLVDGEHPQE